MKIKPLFFYFMLFVGILSLGIHANFDGIKKLIDRRDSVVPPKGKMEIQELELAWKRISSQPDHDADSKKRKLNLYLELIAQINEVADPSFIDWKLPMLNVSVPGHPFYNSGMAPESIKDPDVRKRYEDAIEENIKYTKLFNKEAEVHALLNNVNRSFNDFIIESFPLEHKDIVNKAAERALGKDASKELLRDYSRQFKR